MVLTSLSFVFSSCEHHGKRGENQVENIVFYALPKGIDRFASLVSFQDLKREGRDTLITDKRFVRRFTRMVNRLTPTEERATIDMRSAAVIAMKTGDSLFIAFGENWSTVILNDNGKDEMVYDGILGYSLPSMTVNGVFMKDNPTLFHFIDKNVYAPHSNDYWFNDHTQEIIKSVREQPTIR